MPEPRRILFSAQKNEGPFLLEWVAYHKALGFTDIFIVSNDCDDGSDRLLNALADSREVFHFMQTVPAGVAAQKHAAQIAADARWLRDGDWVIWLDADEFLLPSKPEHGVADLIASMGGARALHIAWRFFGDSGHRHWPGRHVSRDFLMAAPRRKGQNAQVKTLFRYGPEIERLDIHRPILEPGTTRDHFPAITSSGGPADDKFYDTRRDRPFNRLVAQKRPYILGQIAHFSIRTPEMFSRKARRGDGYYANPAAVARDEELYRRRNFNVVPEEGLARRKPETDREMQRLYALPGVATACREIEGFRFDSESKK
ncbi:MAG: glycosyltransferase family 2 protein [Pseudomonadota bacterium]